MSLLMSRLYSGSGYKPCCTLARNKVAKQAGRRPLRSSEARISRLGWGVLKFHKWQMAA
jgi:hypothetical protein